MLSEDKIVRAIGHLMDNRFRVDVKTKGILRVIYVGRVKKLKHHFKTVSLDP